MFESKILGVSDIGFPSLVKYQYPDVVYTGPDVKIKFHGGITTGLAGIVVTNIRYVLNVESTILQFKKC